MNPGLFSGYGAAPSGGIKSIQRGVITLTGGAGTATISPVNTNKTELRHLGSQSGSAGTGNGTLVLTNSTTVTAASSYATGTVSWELTERF